MQKGLFYTENDDKLIQDDSELTSMFIQLQQKTRNRSHPLYLKTRNRSHPLYLTPIRYHTGLPGPLAQGNNESDQLLLGIVLEASKFHKKHHINSKGLMKEFSMKSM
jgi:hypothetical protein